MLTLRKKHLNTPALLLLVLIALGLQSCSSEDTADTTTRELDRQREAAQQISNVFSQVAGNYSGQTQSQSAQILLSLKINDVSQQGTQVPQPTLSGTLTVIPRALSESPTHSNKITYVISAGEYDPGKQKLSFQVQQPPNGNTTNVECSVQNDTQMNCDWYLINDSEFSVTKTSQALQSGTFGSPADKGNQGLAGSYIGQSQDFRKIVAVFNTLLSNPNGSQGAAQVTIAGRFELYSNDKDSDGSYSSPDIISFTDGTFDRFQL
jgi:hypothetical protein